MKLEYRLADLATFHKSDTVAKYAMKALRLFYDKTYFWCEDCDGIATTKKDCCLSRIETPEFKEMLDKYSWEDIWNAKEPIKYKPKGNE